MEDAYIINGGQILKGKIKLSGAKNVALKIIIAGLLFDQKVTLKNIPRIKDVFELIGLIDSLGGEVKFTDKNTVTVDGQNINKNKIDFLFGSKIRVSFMLFAPLLHKFKKCFVPNPGGCRIGARPIDRIVEGMRSLGVGVNYNSNTGYYQAEINRPISGNYTFNKPSHTATELLILLSIFGRGKIVLSNVALEPEIDDLINFLNQAGADIKREADKILINPVKKLVQTSPYTIVSDRNEAITYATLAIATKGDITLYPLKKEVIAHFLAGLKKINAGVEIKNNQEIRFYWQGQIKSSTIETLPHPGFMTDWQPNWAVLMTQAKGESLITERVFENRFSYVEELKKLGAKIEFFKTKVKNPSEFFFFNYDSNKQYQQTIKITGGYKLHEGVLTIADLRAGATLAIAALIVNGQSVINGASIMERGYDSFVEKITSLGGLIKKV